MTTFPILLTNVCMFALLMLPGLILGKKGKVSDSSVDTFGELLSNVAMPALVLCKLIETDSNALRLTDILVCLLLPLAVIPIGCFMMRFLIGKNTDALPSASFCAVFSNCGFLGIPIASAVFPDAPEVAVYVSLFNVVSTFMLLTVGASMLSHSTHKTRLREVIFTPITVCVAVGGLILALGLQEYFAPLATYASYFSMLTTPLSMIVLGYELSKLSLKKIFTCSVLYPTVVVKLVVLPLAALVVLLLLDLIPYVAIGEELAMAMLIATGVSTAASAPALAKKYNADAFGAAIFTVGGTLLCVVTLPLIWLVFGYIF